VRLYLADLAYDSVRTNHVVPLNVGYLAAALDARFGRDLEITLFKYPTELEQAIRDQPPDMLGLSHYSWNTRLDEVFLEMVRRLNPSALTVMGGPNIRNDAPSIDTFLRLHDDLDYYILFEGEDPFVDLVEALLGGDRRPAPQGCATLIDGELAYAAQDFAIKPKDLEIPDMTPLLETNRGCPYGCVYCVWGVVALSKIRRRPLDVVYEEFDYVVKHSAGQVNWTFCDANFGIFPRDVEIARTIQGLKEKHGLPVTVDAFASKNNTPRNVEIANILGRTARPLVAIQSADQDVLAKSGRGKIKFDHLVKQIDHYRSKNLEVCTDILVGLPGESAESQMGTLMKAFELGFDDIQSGNIRLLPGSDYESPEFRQTYGVNTKYRPIFGAYGKYDGKLVFEREESVRDTNHMSELEMNEFKVLHWLIFFAWNLGMFKPLLRFGRQKGVNPGHILAEIAKTQEPRLKALFDEMKEESLSEWFDSEDEMAAFYGQEENFDSMVENFMKLNTKYMARVFMEPETVEALEAAVQTILRSKLAERGVTDVAVVDDVCRISTLMVCNDLLQEEFRAVDSYPGEVAAVIMNDPDLADEESVDIEISRPEEFVKFCRFHLVRDGEKDFSLRNLSRFMEGGVGLGKLMNEVAIVGSDAAAAPRNEPGQYLS
jgi:radical SAM superfamily enzyme YgiQ (UPF0313 family)